ncbi:Integrator complex subunit 4 [Echinococcus granulosus]|uniref:Integrator complex subunit 4 n=1 Tax=Echinococcus granulosus TaxID=6210 RepID=W6UBI2_ECHGR|nr:Integrator complex subunit 4 [Echinococcus granulosus]EUB57926.1 Integrator complex subunit 4 [Echinococcus granulosus]
MEATWWEKPAFCKLIDSTPGLYYYHLPDWAGLGAAFYVPHTYRCLLPDAGELSPSDYQNHLTTSLLRLPSKAAHDICELNRELISRLRSHDYAFSSARVNLNTVPGVCEALESLASMPVTGQLSSVDSKSSLLNGEEGGNEEYRENGVAPISQMELHCLRFGLITPGTDTSEMVQMVLRMANIVEEDSNYVNSLSEVVKRGIEEATLHMKEERTKIMREQGVLRQVPYLDKLINWWSPPVSTQIHGRMLNLSIGELVPTDSILPVSSPPVARHDQSNEDSAKNEKEPSPSALQSDLASIRASALTTLAIKSNPDVVIGSMTAADLILAFCADSDARVRATALNCLCSWAQYEKHKHDAATNKRKFEWISDHWLQVYVLACRLITEDTSKVRQVSLRAIHLLGLRFSQKEVSLDTVSLSGGAIENASLDVRSSLKKINPIRRKCVKLVDDAFSRVCDRLQDPSRFVRETAAGLIADLAKFVSEESLMMTLEKTVMSDRQVKRSSDRASMSGGVDKVALWGTVSSPSPARSKQRGAQPPAGPVSVDSISLLSTGALGALINGLEDEFHEVRCATLSTITQIATHNARFASLCQDILVDMLTDDIQVVRLRAVTALQTVGDQVPIMADQVGIVTSALAEDSVVIRQRIHNLLSRCRLISPPCLLSLLDGLLANLRAYPEDRDSVWNCAAAVGRRHPAFVEVCVYNLLRAHPWLSEPEPIREDPVYITVLLLVLNAHPGAPGIAAHFPRHLATSQPYLRELVPHLLPKETMHFPFVWKPSTDLCLMPKRQRLDESAEMATSDQLLRFLASTVEMLRRLTLDCIDTLPNHQVEPMDVDDNPTVDLQQCHRLNRMKRVLSQELRVCQQTVEGGSWLGDLPSWLSHLLTAVHCLLSACLPNNNTTVFDATAAITTPNQQTVLLKQAHRLLLKAEHMYLGLNSSEISAIRALRSVAHSSPFFLDTDAVRRTVKQVVEACPMVDELAAAVGRIRKLHAQLLHPPPVISDVNTASRAEQAVTGCKPLPEIKFTALLGTAAIRICALVTGLSLDQARDHVRVIYRRPDIGKQHQRQCSWQPPAHAWTLLESPLPTNDGDKSFSRIPSKTPTLELQTTLELTASSWTATATLEVGLGLSVPTALDEDASSSTIISLLPPGVVAKVKLHPCDSSYTW